MSSPDDATRTLEEIEDDRWGDAPEGSSTMVTRVHALRRRPVATLDTEDRRLLVSQRVGLDVIVPLALAELRKRPLAEGDYYPGDLLSAVLRVPDDYWSGRPREAALLRALAGSVDQQDPDFPVGTDLPELIVAFTGG